MSEPGFHGGRRRFDSALAGAGYGKLLKWGQDNNAGMHRWKS
jgi:hypothetical protein